MAFNEYIGDRLRRALQEQKAAFTEKHMMGGLALMVNDKMCVGVIDDKVMARVDPDIYEACLERPGCRPMDFTGRPMKGWLFISGEGMDTDEDLAYWVQLALEYNPKANKSKKKKT